ncbi:MAG TPA: DUF1501 domain-containing protein [Pirellulales bacterium]|nr:DUF1501 domain-containing protein [Pirellulales bacterium]
MPRFGLSRRQWLQTSAGALGLSLPQWLNLSTARSAETGFGRAKSCIVLYCWGGVSHIDTWDPKPDAPAEVRGEFKPIATATPGIQLGEHMPLMAQLTERLAIIRSIHHGSTFHGRGMYWNMTGHPTPNAEQFTNLAPSSSDWPNLGAMIARLRSAAPGMPGSVQIPYHMVDNKTRQAGDTAGWLGQRYDAVVVRPSRGKPFGGISPDTGHLTLKPAEGVDDARFVNRRRLAESLGAQCRPLDSGAGAGQYAGFRQMAVDLLSSPKVREAFDVEKEPETVHAAYGDHLCGQSALLARRLVENGVPAVTVICAAGDLNGASGDMWDTHGDNFNRLKRDLLPPLERASFALVNDLAQRGMLDETLVVWLTEFGRTPKIGGGSGRDHYPFCYSVALAGGGVRGGQVYGRSDHLGAFPLDFPCTPADLHATIFHALGISPETRLTDNFGRTLPICEGSVLPLFA